MGIIQPVASVVITVKNEAKNLPPLLNILLKSSIPAEIIIVDSNSEDGTAELMARISKENSLVKYIRMPCSRGQGRNIGVRESETGNILFTDGDAVPREQWIENMVSALKDNELVAGKTESFDGKGTSTIPRMELFFMGFEITLPSMNLAIRKELFNRLKGFDESFVTAEDIDMNLRAVMAGAKWAVCDKCVVSHRSRENIPALMKQAFWNGYGRRQLRNKNREIWKQIEKGKIRRESMTFHWLLRNFTGLLGYMYCMLRKINFEENAGQ